jgi:hypothetical protein
MYGEFCWCAVHRRISSQKVYNAKTHVKTRGLPISASAFAIEGSGKYFNKKAVVPAWWHRKRFRAGTGHQTYFRRPANPSTTVERSDDYVTPRTRNLVRWGTMCYAAIPVTGFQLISSVVPHGLLRCSSCSRTDWSLSIKSKLCLLPRPLQAWKIFPQSTSHTRTPLSF